MSTTERRVADPISLARGSGFGGRKLFACGLETAGSDWQVWKVRDVETGQDLSDELNWVKFSAGSPLPND